MSDIHLRPEFDRMPMPLPENQGEAVILLLSLIFEMAKQPHLTNLDLLRIQTAATQLWQFARVYTNPTPTSLDCRCPPDAHLQRRCPSAACPRRAVD